MKKKLQEIENRDFVRSNKLVNGRVKLKAKSYDLIRSISTLVSPNDTDFWTYEVEVKSLSIDYKRAKEYIRDIMRNPIEIQNDNKQTFDCYSWCSSMKYKNGFITFKLDPEMREFMLQIKGNYTKTFEKYILPMESIYAKRIYEMLYQLKDYGYRKFELEELQKNLDVPKSFKSYSNFKKFVLVIAIKEINKHTDIYIPINTENLKDESWIKLQCGKTRKITHINFEFTVKSKDLPVKTNQEVLVQNNISTKDRLKDFDITENIIDDLLIECGIAQKMDEELNQRFISRLYDILESFKKWVVQKDKNFTDLEYSFKKYVQDGFSNGFWVL